MVVFFDDGLFSFSGLLGEVGEVAPPDSQERLNLLHVRAPLLVREVHVSPSKPASESRPPPLMRETSSSVTSVTVLTVIPTSASGGARVGRAVDKVGQGVIQIAAQSFLNGIIQIVVQKRF